MQLAVWILLIYELEMSLKGTYIFAEIIFRAMQHSPPTSTRLP